MLGHKRKNEWMCPLLSDGHNTWVHHGSENVYNCTNELNAAVRFDFGCKYSRIRDYMYPIGKYPINVKVT